jgi:hypothetical protein
MKTELSKIAQDLEQGAITENEAQTLLLGLLGVSKRFYWLKPDNSISNMWNEEDHLKYLTDKDIEDAQKDGWQCIQINVL